MQNKYVNFLGSFGKKLLLGTVHVSMASIAIFNFSNVAAAKTAGEYAQIFYKNGYRYCDARKLAKVWGGSVYDAKVTGGKKISWGNASYLQSEWRKGVKFFQRYGFTCGQSSLTTEKQKFAYNDASSVVKAWTKGEKS